MGALKKYNPKEVTITWLGRSLNSGVSAGTFFTAARTVRKAQLNTGSDGRSTLVESENRTGVMTVSYRAGSESNDFLVNRQLQDEADNRQIGMLQIKDFSGRSLFTDEQASLDGPPDVEKGDEEGDQQWTFLCPDMNIEARGNNDATTIAPAQFDGNV